MPQYKIAYSGWTTIIVEAESEEQAKEKFYDDGLNDLFDAEVDEITEVKNAD